MSAQSQTHLQALRERIQALEADPDMRKGRLIASVLTDPTIDWDALFAVLTLRGRHRGRQRWRRVLVQSLMRRHFPRGGARQAAAPPAAVVGAGGGGRALCEAPWYEDVAELAPFAPADVWERFRDAYPVLAVYRSGWIPDAALASTAHPDPAHWAALWQRDADGYADLADVAAALAWPDEVCAPAALVMIVPLCTRLWHELPWSVWAVAPADAGVSTDSSVDAAPRVRRAAVPVLRRCACLLRGFHLGGCSVRGVWQAIRLSE